MGRRAMTLADLPEKYRKEAERQLAESASGVPIRPNLPLSTPVGGSDTPLTVKTGKKRMRMTKTEEEFSRILDARKERGEILMWLYEPATLRWGVLDILRYTPDFIIFDKIEDYDLTPEIPRIQMRLIEVKGSYIHNESRAMRTFKDARNHWHGIFHFELHQKTKAEGWQQIY